MSKITINIPEEVADRVIDGFCKRYNYTDVSANEKKNKAGKVKFVKEKVMEFIKRAVHEAEAEEARKAAMEAVSKSIDDDIVLT